jgi:hypothetical protein
MRCLSPPVHALFLLCRRRTADAVLPPDFPDGRPSCALTDALQEPTAAFFFCKSILQVGLQDTSAGSLSSRPFREGAGGWTGNRGDIPRDNRTATRGWGDCGLDGRTVDVTCPGNFLARRPRRETRSSAETRLKWTGLCASTTSTDEGLV